MFIEKTVGALLRETAARCAEGEALVCPEFGVRQTWTEFLAHCELVARGLMALGVKRGDHVAVWATNLPEWVHLQFSLGMIGAVFVTVNTNFKSSELEYIVGQSDSTTLFLCEGWRDTCYYDVVRDVVPELDACKPGQLESVKLTVLKNVVYIGERTETPGMLKYAEMLELGRTVSREALLEREAQLHYDDVMNMQYTSGTTGFPKGVMLTHLNIISNAAMVGEVMGMSPVDRLLIQVPLFHCFGLVMSTMNCAVYGSTMVVMEAFNALKSMQFIQNERCTAVNGVPTMFIATLNHPEFNDYDFTSLRTGIMAGSPCPVEAMNQVRAKMHCSEIVIAFGQTECSPVMTMTRRDDPVELRVSTVGRLFAGVEGRIVDPQNGRELPPNTKGEIVTRSRCVMRGYYKMPDETAQAIDAKGWLHTGDVGVIDEQGYFSVTGRIKDMVIRGGENIYPREIEEFLHRNDKIADVYVVGVPDAKYGEQLLAVVKLHEGQSATVEELRSFCDGKLARYKIPHYWDFVNDFPMTASGKVQKFKIVEQFTREHHLV